MLPSIKLIAAGQKLLTSIFNGCCPLAGSNNHAAMDGSKQFCFRGMLQPCHRVL